MERVVDRTELLSEPSTRPPSPDAEDIKNLAEFEFIHRQDDVQTGNEVQGGDDEMDFCLFAPVATASDAAPTVAKIRIQTPPLTEGEPGILSSRDEGYYFAKALSQEGKENLQSVALSGEDVIARSHDIWPGSAYDWKILHIPATKRQRLLLSTPQAFAKLVPNGLESKRKRPGKKYRLKLRAKLAAAKAKKEESQKSAEEKEAAEREKRTRRNREKKVKKKQREKAKKAAGGGSVVEQDQEGSSSE